MATYTTLDHQGLQTCLDQIQLGQLQTFRRASHGIENSNYLLTVITPEQQSLDCVLTVYEELPKQQIEIYTRCLTLWGKTLSVPKPLHTSPQPVAGAPEKVFVVYTKLSGEHILHPDVTHCEQLGVFLAQFHLAAQKTPLSLTGTRSIPWVLDYMPTSPTCSAREIEQFQSYQARIQDLPILLENCPKGWVHGDLFPDNAFFTGQQLSGVIDFNNACTDYLLLDLCITLNAWSSLGIEHSCPKRFEAMLSAYTTVRPLTEVERHAMPKTLLAAALRFWASRIDFTRDFGGKKGKEPAEYQRLAAHYVAQIES